MSPLAPRRPSLRVQLLRWLLLPLVAIVPLAAAAMYFIAVRPALDSLDHALSGTAAALAERLTVEDGRAALALSEDTARALRTDPFDRVSFAVLDAAGRLLAGDAPLAALRPPVERGRTRYLDGELDALPVRMAAVGVPCGPAQRETCSVLVAESLAKRADVERAVLASAALVALLLAASLVFLALVAVTRGLRPLARLGDAIEQRSLGHLQPIDDLGVPSEAATIALAVNRLLARLRQAAEAQKKFIADAAHQLRTPLATLRAESELALTEAHPPEFDATLRRLAAGSERAARLANQLLSLATSESALEGGERRSVDLKALAAEEGERWLSRALEAGIDLGFELAPARVTGHETALRELLANLLHNALEYAGRGATVTLRCVREGAAVRLEVEDDGPGIAAADRERVWQRFQRGPGAPGAGSGLGLAIVRDIARAHGAEATLHEGPGGRGLCVRVVFAAAG